MEQTDDEKESLVKMKNLPRSMQEIIKIQWALKPLGYGVCGYRRKDRPDEFVLRLREFNLVD